MTTVTKTIRVHRPAPEMTAILEDPDQLMSIVSGFGRATYLRTRMDHSQEWDLFFQLGTMYIGGRVLVETTGSELLGWHSISGFTHSSRFTVRPCGTAECEVEATTVLSLDGMLAARVAGLLVRGFIGRNLEATLESLRHYAEYGD